MSWRLVLHCGMGACSSRIIAFASCDKEFQIFLSLSDKCFHLSGGNLVGDGLVLGMDCVI